MTTSKLRLFFELALIVALFIIYSLYKLQKDADNKAAVKIGAKATLKNPTVKAVAKFKDSTGATHLEVPAGINQVPRSALKDTGVTNGSIVDTAARNMHIKPDQLLELTRENLQLKAENIQLKAAKDTPGNTVFDYRDKWLRLAYDTKTNRANLGYNVNITTGKFRPASFLPFSSKPPLLDLSADDPRATINNVQHFSTIIPQPFVGFTADVKGLYDIDSKQIIPSIGANLRLGRWHLEGRAYYYQKVKQAASVSYDVIKF